MPRHSKALTIAAMLGAAAVAQPRVTAQDAPRPNVLIILADDLGFSDLGCYGGEIATPNLDALAAGGLRFTQCYNTGRCWPTRAALMTGYYAQQVRRDRLPGVSPSGGRGTRPDWAPLLPTLIRPLGYRAYHSGKWHIDGQPLQNGFDHSYRLDDHDRYFHPRRHAEDDRPLPAIDPGGDHYTTTAIADHAIRCLRDHAATHAERPFFLLLAFTSPHFPLQAKAEDVARYRDRYARGWEAVRADRFARQRTLEILDAKLSPVERDLGPPYRFADAYEALGPGEVDRPLRWADLTDEQRAFQAAKMAVHAAMVDRMDREVGRVVDQLREMDALDDTLVLFLSDNGASAEIMVRGDGHDPAAPPGSARSFLCLGPGWSTTCNTPFRRHKTWVHEGGIATPLIAHWPRGIAARGELRRTAAHVIDVVPTVLELAGHESPAARDGAPPDRPGRSLLHSFASDEVISRDELWWSHEGHRALRAGNWKLVAAKGDPWELYDLAADRSETEDLASSEPDRVRAMALRWQELEDGFRAALDEKD